MNNTFRKLRDRLCCCSKPYLEVSDLRRIVDEDVVGVAQLRADFEHDHTRTHTCCSDHIKQRELSGNEPFSAPVLDWTSTMVEEYETKPHCSCTLLTGLVASRLPELPNLAPVRRTTVQSKARQGKRGEEVASEQTSQEWE